MALIPPPRPAGLPEPDARSRRPLPGVLAIAVVLLTAATAPAEEGNRGDDPPGGRASAFGHGTSGAFDGTLGIAATVVLAAVGVAVLIGARMRPAGAPGALRVVGRAHLTGRHAVYLLRAGDRTLIVGVGAQGPPSLLGELPSPPGEGAVATDRNGGSVSA